MSADNKLSTAKKIISIILGAFLIGFMWRARGTHGFGSMWGIIYVSTVITLLVYAFYGNREKVKYELIPVGTLFAALTTPAWGIVNQLMGGEIPTGLKDPDSFDVTDAVINGWHGLPLLLMTGFTLLCLYSIFIGTLFAKRDYKIWHYGIYIAVFFVVVYIAKLTFANNLLNVIAPEITDNFTKGLAMAGKDVTAKEFFVKNMFDSAVFKKIPFGRAYYESILHISYTFGSLAVILTALIAFRDKITAIVSFVINLFGMMGITLADVFNINAYDGETSVLYGVNLPSFLRITSWPLWEYFTGFFIGFGVMFILALLPNRITAGRKYRNEPVIRHKVTRFIYHLIFVMAVGIFAAPVRCFGMRLADTLEAFGLISEGRNEMVSYIIMGVAAVAVLIPVILVLESNILHKNLPVPVKLKPDEFAKKFLPIYVFVTLIFFMLPDDLTLSLIMGKITNPSEHKGALTEVLSNAFAMCSSLVFFIVWFISQRTEKKQAS